MKGQIMGQAFVFILALVIFSLVLLFGVRTLMNWMDWKEMFEYVKVGDDIERAIETTGFGSVKQVRLRIPGDNTEICFVDNRGGCKNDNYPGGNWGGLDCSSTSITINPVICNYWEDCADSNMFIMEKNRVRWDAYVGQLAVPIPEKGFYCFKIRNPVTNFTINGVGAYAQLAIS